MIPQSTEKPCKTSLSPLTTLLRPSAAHTSLFRLTTLLRPSAASTFLPSEPGCYPHPGRPLYVVLPAKSTLTRSLMVRKDFTMSTLEFLDI